MSITDCFFCDWRRPVLGTEDQRQAYSALHMLFRHPEEAAKHVGDVEAFAYRQREFIDSLPADARAAL